MIDGNGVVYDSELHTFCSRCERMVKRAWKGAGPNQIHEGISVEVYGYDGGFFDTLFFADEKPLFFKLCKACSVWLAIELPGFWEASNGSE